MDRPSAFALAIQVENMRNAQKMYFSLIKQAKATKQPADFAAAKKTLEKSKQLEVVVDDTVQQIFNEVTAPES